MRCPKCRSSNWDDIPPSKDGDPTRFRCIRCGHVIRLSGCSACGARNWVRLPDMSEKGGLRPVYRYECTGCARVLGLIIG